MDGTAGAAAFSLPSSSLPFVHPAALRDVQRIERARQAQRLDEALSFWFPWSLGA